MGLIFYERRQKRERWEEKKKRKKKLYSILYGVCIMFDNLC